MRNKVFQQLEDNNIPYKAKVLCAVSGGIDSCVMLHLLNDYGFQCVVAHCNFQLRGEESNGDEKFVRDYSEKLEVVLESQVFDTEQYAKEMGLSIQMAARDLRYNYFHELMSKHKCDYLAVAHNSDDQAETIITNLIRGTGVRGLTGMQFIKENLLRPILNISREEIEQFSDKYEIAYRTDSTNATTKYSRNKIRHAIFPLMEEITPAYKSNILRSIDYLKDTEQIMNSYVKIAKDSCFYYKGDKAIIDIPEILKFAAPQTVLFEILIEEGIPKNLAADSVNLLNSQTGKSCTYLHYHILRDRDTLIVDKNFKANPKVNIEFSADNFAEIEQYAYTVELIDISELKEIKKDANIAYLDFDKLVFPIKIRNWQDGDKFKPLGMNNFKKLSDFFSDMKFSMYDKSAVQIFESDKNIIWIAGYRVDNRFKVSDDTKRVMRIVKRGIGF